MIPKTIPVLVHEDCMDSISVGLAKQEANIAKIAEDTNAIEGNTTAIKTSSANANTTLSQIDADTSAIRTNSGNIKNNTDSLASSVGLPEDAASANTVIGLLKSISNRITTF